MTGQVLPLDLVSREMKNHRWVDVKGWGGALAGTMQCDYCNRVASPTDPRRQTLLDSECEGRR